MIHEIVEIDLRLAPGAWPMPEALREGVAAHWQAALARNPKLWNGRMLGTVAPGRPGGLRVEDGILRGTALEDAFAAFLHWRDSGFPEIGIRNLFGSAAILTADDALVFGVMGGWTANAGRIYPPGGSLEPGDVLTDGRVDVVGSIERELAEETGLAAGEAEALGTYALFDGPRISISRVLRFAEPEAALVARVRANLAAQAHRELADVVAIRSVAEAKALPMAVPYTALLAEAVFGGTAA